MGEPAIQDHDKSKEELLEELQSLRRTVADLRNREFERVRGEQAVREQLRREVEEARREAEELRANTGLTAEAA